MLKYLPGLASTLSIPKVAQAVDDLADGFEGQAFDLFALHFDVRFLLRPFRGVDLEPLCGNLGIQCLLLFEFLHTGMEEVIFTRGRKVLDDSNDRNGDWDSSYSGPIRNGEDEVKVNNNCSCRSAIEHEKHLTLQALTKYSFSCAKHFQSHHDTLAALAVREVERFQILDCRRVDLQGLICRARRSVRERQPAMLSTSDRYAPEPR